MSSIYLLDLYRYDLVSYQSFFSSIADRIRSYHWRKRYQIWSVLVTHRALVALVGLCSTPRKIYCLGFAHPVPRRVHIVLELVKIGVQNMKVEGHVAFHPPLRIHHVLHNFSDF